MKRVLSLFVEIRTVLPLVVLSFLFSRCTSSSDGKEHPASPSKKAVVVDRGARILFPPESPGLQQIDAVPIKKGSAIISAIAPARIVASISRASSGEKNIQFESLEVTSLYSQYRQAKSNVELTTKNLARLQEMFDNNAATAKDLTQAQTDAANARVAKAEYEGKLRSLGFNPLELEAVKPGTVWLISDVPETQLNEVQRGEEVDITFSSSPHNKYVGRAEAIGEVVDPLTRTVKVRVALHNPNGRFLPGMFARVDFGDPVNGVLTVPPSAVVTIEGQDYVFVQRAPGEFLRTPVTLSTANSDVLIVKKGLDDGEQVVVRGTMLLKGLSFGY